jgi:glycosyltransferase involved in cell wall biosynthesis
MTDMSLPHGSGVSVVVTTYNYERFIIDALDSVLAQTLQPFEVVVIDDGSTDDTARIVAAFADRGVRYVRQSNGGAAAARNRGIRETTGDLVGFLDADDIWLPTKLERQVEYLARNPDAVMVSGQKIWWDFERDTRRIEVIRELDGSKQRREICITNTVGNPSMVLVRRDAIRRAGPFDETLRWGQDWEFFIRIASLGRVGVDVDPVIIYRWHDGGLSHERRSERLSVLHSISRRAIANYERRWLRLPLRARAWSAVEFERARLTRKTGDPWRKQALHAIRSLAAYPWSNGRTKAALVARVVIGETGYRGIRDRMRSFRSPGIRRFTG